jgi:hypothetical protein
MPLSFPFPSCSFDATKSRVDFWGSDYVIEVPFHLEADALKKLCPLMGDTEVEFLRAFGSEWKRIHEVAGRIYVPEGKSTYTFILAAQDF